MTLQALALLHNRHTEDALKVLNEAIKFDKKNDLAYLERGRLWLTLGKSSKAKNDLIEAVSLGNTQAKEMLDEIPGNK